MMKRTIGLSVLLAAMTFSHAAVTVNGTVIENSHGLNIPTDYTQIESRFVTAAGLYAVATREDNGLNTTIYFDDASATVYELKTPAPASQFFTFQKQTYFQDMKGQVWAHTPPEQLEKAPWTLPTMTQFFTLADDSDAVACWPSRLEKALPPGTQRQGACQSLTMSWKTTVDWTPTQAPKLCAPNTVVLTYDVYRTRQQSVLNLQTGNLYAKRWTRNPCTSWQKPLAKVKS